MTTQEILTKANEAIKNATFTNLKKARKNAAPMFLIVSCGNGLSLYGSYSSETYYASYGNQTFQLV
jgi:hypothetical protein